MRARRFQPWTEVLDIRVVPSDTGVVPVVASVPASTSGNVIQDTADGWWPGDDLAVDYGWVSPGTPPPANTDPTVPPEIDPLDPNLTTPATSTTGAASPA